MNSTVPLNLVKIFVDRLDERQRRKDFILERNLLHPSPFGDLSREEEELVRRYDPFMRFHSKEEHEELVRAALSEYRIGKRLQDLKVLPLAPFTPRKCIYAFVIASSH